MARLPPYSLRASLPGQHPHPVQAEGELLLRAGAGQPRLAGPQEVLRSLIVRKLRMERACPGHQPGQPDGWMLRRSRLLHRPCRAFEGIRSVVVQTSDEVEQEQAIGGSIQGVEISHLDGRLPSRAEVLRLLAEVDQGLPLAPPGQFDSPSRQPFGVVLSEAALDL